MVLTFRNVHNWIISGTVEAVFAGMFRALRSGGVLGVVEHRANPALPVDPKAVNGYVHESQVIAFAEAAGFRLAARTEINANPLDTKDYAAGVWTLPPTLRVNDVERGKYLAIGESDRMTLRFVKP
jgi:predicted methyltransferase